MNLIDARNALPVGGPGSDPATWAVRSSPPNLVCIHHSVTPPDTTVEAIARYHVAPPPNGKGRPTICYHYVIATDGTVYWCVDEERFVWHGNGGNTGIGVCLIGDFTETTPALAQLAAARDLVAQIRGRYPGVPVIGHREATGAQTACPGDTWPEWKESINDAPVAVVDATVVAPDYYARYPKPPGDTGAGIHLGANGYFPLGEDQGPVVAYYAGEPVFQRWLESCQGLRSRGLTWAVVLTIDDSALACLPTILYSGIMPVLRVVRKYPGRINEKSLSAVRRFCAMGGRYVQIGNEPNLACEWDRWPSASEWPAAFRQWAIDWYADAQPIEAAGGFVGIDPLAPGGNWRGGHLVYGDGDDPAFLEAMLRELRNISGATALLQRCGWVSVHPALLNHPLNYPDDPVNQAEHPGQTVLSRYYANGMPTGASNCWRKWELVDHIVQTELGLRLPIIGTEGGAWALNGADPRYPALTAQTASDANVAMLRSMRQTPRWFLAQCPWLWANRWWGNRAVEFEIDAWIRVPGWGNCPADQPAKLPLVDDLLAAPIAEREVEPVDVATVIGQTLQGHVIPLNPATAFERAGAARGLLPASPEVDVVIEGVDYRSQVYRHPADRAWQWIVYCKVGEWDKLIWFKRAN